MSNLNCEILLSIDETPWNYYRYFIQMGYTAQRNHNNVGLDHDIMYYKMYNHLLR